MYKPGPMQQTKLVLLGSSGTGKSSLVLRFVRGVFFDRMDNTIGAAFLTKTMPEKGIRFEIWDTAGQERYHILAPMYYRAAVAAVVVYDITSAESFDKAKFWVKELQQQGNPDAVVALAGNKVDAEAQRSVTADTAKAYAEENGLLFWETSAKTNVNVAEVFNDIAERLPCAAAAAPQRATDSITLTEPAPQQRKRSWCCWTS